MKIRLNYEHHHTHWKSTTTSDAYEHFCHDDDKIVKQKKHLVHKF